MTCTSFAYSLPYPCRQWVGAARRKAARRTGLCSAVLCFPVIYQDRAFGQRSLRNA